MFGQFNKNDSIILIQSLVITIITNLLLFSALVRRDERKESESVEKPTEMNNKRLPCERKKIMYVI